MIKGHSVYPRYILVHVPLLCHTDTVFTLNNSNLTTVRRFPELPFERIENGNSLYHGYNKTRLFLLFIRLFCRWLKIGPLFLIEIEGPDKRCVCMNFYVKPSFDSNLYVFTVPHFVFIWLGMFWLFRSSSVQSETDMILLQGVVSGG